MATRKKPASKAVATRKTTDVANIDELLAQEAAGIQDQIGAPSSNKIRTADKVFTFPDGTVTPEPIRVVILDFVSQNKLYEGKYDPNNPIPPVCFAIGKVLKDMVPSDNSLTKQCDNCGQCPNNEFGSDGNGKACKNTRVLAVMAPDATEDDEVMTLEVSPTGLKSYDAYVATVTRLYGKPPIAVTTEVSFDENVSYSTLRFGNPEPNSNLAVHFAKREEAQVMITAEPDMSNAEAPKPARGKGSRNVRRTAARRGRAA